MRIPPLDDSACAKQFDEILTNSATRRITPIEMKLTINGETQEIEAANLSLVALLAELGFGEIPVLVEHNGTALRGKEHSGISVEEGDQLEIIRIVAGG